MGKRKWTKRELVASEIADYMSRTISMDDAIAILASTYYEEFEKLDDDIFWQEANEFHPDIVKKHS